MMENKPKPADELEPRDDWDPRSNESVRELLDHLAKELAEEYIRLMKEVASNEEDNEQ